MNDRLKNSPVLKLITILFLILILMIPSFMIQDLIRERETRREEAVFEVSEKWGRMQTITGPVLSFSYEGFTISGRTFVNETACFLPEILNINGNIVSEIRKRGIYEVPLYNSKLIISGEFKAPDFTELGIDTNSIKWDKAVMNLGITDLKGIKGNVTINFDGKKLNTNPGIQNNRLIKSGITAVIGERLESSAAIPFQIEIDLSGSSRINFIPAGKSTTVKISSNWINPGFCGEFLPEKRSITEDGFSSEWRISHLNRNFPQSWLGTDVNLESSSFGVEFLLPVDQYQKTMRTSKYDFLFIGLTFLAFFLIEILNKKHLHPFQYAMIGFALVIFYLLLLSVGEQTNYDFAFFFSTLSSISVISLYSLAVLKDKKLVFVILALLLILYGFLFTIIQMQDYALIVGSILLFIVLSIVMFLTRKIDWYSINQQQ